MKRFLLNFLVAMALLLPELPLVAQRVHSSGQIDIQVRNPNGTPARRGIHVLLESGEGGVVDDCRTVDNGKCTFTLATGIYIVRLNEAGYRPTSVRIDLTGITRQFAMLDLKPLEEKAPAAPPRKENIGTQVPVLELNVPEKARQEFELGQKSLEEGHLDEGITHLHKALSIYDSFPQAHFLVGSAYLEQKKWTDAQTSLENAIRLNSKLAEAYLELGAVFNQTHEYPKAEGALTRGLELNPDSPMGHYELAKALWALGRWQDAAPHASAAVAAMPDLAAAHVLLGNILLRRQDLDGAVREYQTYLRLEPNGSMAAGTRETIEKIKSAAVKK
jgi:tetratricopeptide (TPR) repeat protein